MANVEKMSVALSSELAELVRNAVIGGNYNSSSEVIREALRDWKVKQAMQAAEIKVMQVALVEGLADVRAGRTSPASKAFDRLAKKYASGKS